MSRNFLTEVEKYYIQHNYETMSFEKIFEKIPDVDNGTIKAYILNLPPSNKLPKAEPNESLKERQEKIRQSQVTADKFFATKPGAQGIVVMTPAASEISDANIGKSNLPPKERHPDRITTVKRS